MQKLNLTLLAIFIFSLFLPTHAAQTTAETIKWVPYSNNIFENAKKANHPVILFVMADTCTWCQKTESTTFKNPEVIKFITDTYYPVILHADIDTDSANKYTIVGLPTIIVFDLDGKEVKRIEGYLEPTVILDNLKSIQNK